MIYLSNHSEYFKRFWSIFITSGHFLCWVLCQTEKVIWGRKESIYLKIIIHHSE